MSTSKNTLKEIFNYISEQQETSGEGKFIKRQPTEIKLNFLDNLSWWNFL